MLTYNYFCHIIDLRKLNKDPIKEQKRTKFTIKITSQKQNGDFDLNCQYTEISSQS